MHLARISSEGTAWQLAPRLNVRGARFAASFRRRTVSGVDSDAMGGTEFEFLQALPPDASGLPKYDKPTVMLVRRSAGTRAAASARRGVGGNATGRAVSALR
jgi:hypothetical protein